MTTDTSSRAEPGAALGIGIAIGLVLCLFGAFMVFQRQSAVDDEKDAATVGAVTLPLVPSPPPAPPPLPVPPPAAAPPVIASATAVEPAPASVPAPPANPKQMFEEQIKKLTPEQYRITQQSGTERPFTGKYWDHKEDGIYVDVVSGKALFSSLDKFDSGCGWPSFSKPIEGVEIKELSDETAGMIRTEVRSATADSHLGHVFDDGPAELGGLRYCINSASLRFVAVKDLEQEGFGKFSKLFDKKQTAEKQP